MAQMRWSILAVCGLLLLSALAPGALASTRYPLSYKQAKTAAQKRANQEAAKNNRKAHLDSLQRTGKRSFYAQAHWRYQDPHGCADCGYDPNTGQFYDTPTTVRCDVDIKVRRSKDTGKIRATLDGKYCA